jgi:dTDP-4-amino-4,6-dideoxygalactose transaminase
MIKFLDLYKQYISIKDDIDNAIQNVVKDTAFIGGEYLADFEYEFGKYVNSSYTVGVGNGTDALEIAIKALDLPTGSEIIVPSNSFIASSEAVSTCGHKVVFCDICPESYVISVSDLKKRITEKTKAIIAVHLYGHPCDMDQIKLIANEYKLKIIEDCAQAHGARYKNKKVGTIGDIGTFSFYPGKNLGAYGDGGAIVTNNKKLAIKSRMIANHGRVAKYDHEFEGRNSRLDGLQAAILNVKLKHIDKWTELRISIANRYIEKLKNVKEIKLPVRQDWAYQVYHLFVIRTEYRDELKSYLLKNDIETGIHYPLSLAKLNAYNYLNAANEKTFANESDSKLLSLPIGEHLTMNEIDIVCEYIKRFFDSKK